MASIRSWRWLPVAGLGVLFALVPSRLATSGALGIQIVAATAGALVATGGAALVRLGWPQRRRSDLHHLLAATGFFLLCAGAVAMLAGVGLYH
jgi:hypothetical protein